MYLKKSYNKVCNKTQLAIVHGYRENGKVKSKVIKNLGFLEDWLDQYEDPIAHFQEEVRQMNEERKSIVTKLEINLQEKLEPDASNRKNLGYAVPKAVYDRLGLYQFFQYKQRFVNTQYNLNSIFSLLIFPEFIELRFVLESKEERKALAEEIGRYFGTKPEFLGVPSLAYRVGGYLLSKTGLLAGPKNQELIDRLISKGYEIAE